MSAPVTSTAASSPPDRRTPLPVSPWLAWLGPVAVTLLGGLLRIVDLGRPHAVMFDETYYVKDALSLLRHGYEREAIEDADKALLAHEGDLESLDIFTDAGSFVVHPPLGKWLVAGGEWLFGPNPFGWRIAVAVLGTLSILMLARAVWLMTGRALWGTVAGLLLAIDGVAIVMSRTAVLDGILAFFVLAAFLALVLDRRWARMRDRPPLAWSWWRPWRVGAALLLGLACGVKWSGLWYLAAFGLMTVLWEVGRRRRLGAPAPGALLRDALPAAVTMLSLALFAYLATWTGWFLTDGGWDRDWADGAGAFSALQSLWHYHAEALGFHTGLSSEHSYNSPAWGWLIQARPTSFLYESFDTGEGGCTSGGCSREVLALGNPILWWAGVLALLHQSWRWFAARDWRAGAVLAGVLAGWAPWLVYSERTIFAFYSVVFVPFLVAAVTLSLMSIANGPAPGSGRRDRARLTLVGVALLGLVAVSWWFHPIWVGELIDTGSWSARMWWQSWI